MTTENNTKGFRRPLAVFGGLLTALLALAAFELMVRPAFAVSAEDAIGAGRTTRQRTVTTDNTGHDAVLQKTAESAAKAGAKVSIANFTFTPAEITIAVGESVTWVNDDGAPHGLEYSDGAKGTDLLLPGASFSRQFDRPGTYDYNCSVHPYMTGRVVVRAQ